MTVLFTSSLGACSADPDVYPLVPLPPESYAGRYEQLQDRDAVTFLVFGDGGRGSDEQYEVAASMARVCRARDCDFAIGVGDNIYSSGVDDVYDDDFAEKFEYPMAGLGDLQVWMVLGNHDWMGNAQAQIDYTMHSRRWLMPGPDYTVPGLPSWLNLVAFDSQTVLHDVALADAQLDAVTNALCGEPGWHMLFGHHPSVSSGKHGNNDAVRAYLAEIDGACDVHVVFAGHDHHQEHIALPRYDLIIQGAAASVRGVDPVPASLFAVEEEGFAIVDISRDAMRVAFFDDDDRILFGLDRRLDRVPATQPVVSPEVERDAPEMGDSLRR
jgi:hypothetical protein